MAHRSETGEKSSFFRKMYTSLGSSSRQLAATRHDKSQRSDSTSSGTSSGYTQSSPSDGATTSSGHSGTGLPTYVKHHSFNGHLPFARDDPQRATTATTTIASDQSPSILSKRPSLIVPFSNQQQQGTAGNGLALTHAVDNVPMYLDDFQAPISKSGVLIKQANHFKTWKKRLMVLKGHSLFYYVSGTVGNRLKPRGNVVMWCVVCGGDG